MASRRLLVQVLQLVRVSFAFPVMGRRRDSRSRSRRGRGRERDRDRRRSRSRGRSYDRGDQRRGSSVPAQRTGLSHRLPDPNWTPSSTMLDDNEVYGYKLQNKAASTPYSTNRGFAGRSPHDIALVDVLVFGIQNWMLRPLMAGRFVQFEGFRSKYDALLASAFHRAVRNNNQIDLKTWCDQWCQEQSLDPTVFTNVLRWADETAKQLHDHARTLIPQDSEVSTLAKLKALQAENQRLKASQSSQPCSTPGAGPSRPKATPKAKPKPGPSPKSVPSRTKQPSTRTPSHQDKQRNAASSVRKRTLPTPRGSPKDKETGRCQLLSSFHAAASADETTDNPALDHPATEEVDGAEAVDMPDASSPVPDPSPQAVAPGDEAHYIGCAVPTQPELQENQPESFRPVDVNRWLRRQNLSPDTMTAIEDSAGWLLECFEKVPENEAPTVIEVAQAWGLDPVLVQTAPQFQLCRVISAATFLTEN